MTLKYSNNGESTLAGAINTSVTTVTVATGDGAKFPVLGAGDTCSLTLIKLVAGVPTREIVLATARAGDVFTIVRAQESTTALTFSAGDRIENRITAAGINAKADLVAPAFSGAASFAGATSALAAAFASIVEKATMSATAATGTVNFDATTQGVLHYTTNASANWTMNLRGNGSTTLNSLMAVGDCVTCAFIAKQGTTAYYANVVQVDGSAVTPLWQGTAPTAGNVSSTDIYTFTVIKTANAVFTVLASQSKFA